MANTQTSYVVKSGDTLTKIVNNYGANIKGDNVNQKIKTLCDVNHIQDPNIIVVGQVIYFTENASASAGVSYEQEKNVTITSFGFYASDPGMLYASWEWNNENTDHFKILWRYYLDKTNQWIDGEDTSISYEPGKTKYGCKYSYPTGNDKPSQVRFHITPIAKTKTVNDQETPIFTVETVTRLINITDSEPPEAPEISNLIISLNTENKKNVLTLTLENVEIGEATHVQFKLFENKDNTGYVEKEDKTVGLLYIKTTCTFDTLTSGNVYKVQYRGVAKNAYGAWSELSSDIAPAPSSPVIETIKAVYKKPEETTSQNGVEITWITCKSAKQYEFEFLALDANEEQTPEYLFNQSNYEGKITNTVTEEQVVPYTENGTEKAKYTFYGMVDTLLGKNCYVRCKSSNSNDSGGLIGSLIGGGKSDWSSIKHFVYGTVPNFPTVWSSQSSVFPGDTLKIYFIHNAADNSTFSSAKIKFCIDNEELGEYVYGEDYSNSIIKQMYKNNPDNVNDNVYVIEIDTNHTTFVNGETLNYQICTAGIYAENGSPSYGEYSTKKEVKIYATPVFSMRLLDNDNNILNDSETSVDEVIRLLESFPLKVELSLGNMNNQNPVSYHLNIVSDSVGTGYEIADNVGNMNTVTSGTTIFSRYLNSTNTSLTETISANDVSLKSGENYIVNCIAFLSSGLTAKASQKFTVEWKTKTRTPFAEIVFNKDNLSANIRPYVNSSDDITLTVFRKEFDGSFIQIGGEIQNGTTDYVVDPHPALNYARYRIVSRSNTTGAVEYNDTGAMSMDVHSIVLQWDETWSNFVNIEDSKVLSYSPWSGSMLKLPYNINISSDHSPDVSSVEYIGRKHPVTYYGTQTGETESWSVDIPKDDIETLYAIRRLSVWMGDVYVREPSGKGYWANVTVSYSVNSRSLTIPVTFKITRVEGGI